jgi:hypothetical protein
MVVMRCRWSEIKERRSIGSVRGFARKTEATFHDWTAITTTCGRICYQVAVHKRIEPPLLLQRVGDRGLTVKLLDTKVHDAVIDARTSDDGMTVSTISRHRILFPGAAEIRATERP